MARAPDRAVSIDVHEIPGRSRQRVEIADDLAGGCLREHAVAVLPSQARNRVDRYARAAEQRLERFGERDLALAEDDARGASVEVDRRVIGGIRSRRR